MAMICPHCLKSIPKTVIEDGGFRIGLWYQQGTGSPAVRCVFIHSAPISGAPPRATLMGGTYPWESYSGSVEVRHGGNILGHPIGMEESKKMVINLSKWVLADKPKE